MASREPTEPGAGNPDPLWRQTLPNRMERVGETGRRLEEFLVEMGVLPDVVFKVALSFEEVVTNVIKYSHDDSRPHEILIETLVGAEEVRLHVVDRGRAFNPLVAPAPDLDLPVEERPIGGLGIHLVRSLAKTVVYERSGEKNILRLSFSLAPGEA